MASNSLVPTPWHAIFAFLIPAIGTVVQMHFPNSSPLDEHPTNMWIFMICLLFYCFAFGYHIKCQISSTDTTHLKFSVEVAFVSGSLAYAALISVLVPRFLQPLVFTLCFMLLFIYFNYEKIIQICENVALYLYHQQRATEHSHVPDIIINNNGQV